jgi:hypothetical protein
LTLLQSNSANARANQKELTRTGGLFIVRSISAQFHSSYRGFIFKTGISEAGKQNAWNLGNGRGLGLPCLLDSSTNQAIPEWWGGARHYWNHHLRHMDFDLGLDERRQTQHQEPYVDLDLASRCLLCADLHERRVQLFVW